MDRFPICPNPNCEHEFKDAWEWSDSGAGTHECGYCGTAFEWERHVSVKYSTQPVGVTSGVGLPK